MGFDVCSMSLSQKDLGRVSLHFWELCCSLGNGKGDMEYYILVLKGFLTDMAHIVSIHLIFFWWGGMQVTWPCLALSGQEKCQKEETWKNCWTTNSLSDYRSLVCSWAPWTADPYLSEQHTWFPSASSHSVSSPSTFTVECVISLTEGKNFPNGSVRLPFALCKQMYSALFIYVRFYHQK